MILSSHAVSVTLFYGCLRVPCRACVRAYLFWRNYFSRYSKRLLLWLSCSFSFFMNTRNAMPSNCKCHLFSGVFVCLQIETTISHHIQTHSAMQCYELPVVFLLLLKFNFSFSHFIFAHSSSHLNMCKREISGKYTHRETGRIEEKTKYDSVELITQWHSAM